MRDSTGRQRHGERRHRRRPGRRSPSTCRSTGRCSTSATRSRSRSRVTDPNAGDHRLQPGARSTTSSATTATATRSPARPAARARSRPPWTVSTTRTRTSSGSSTPSTPRSARPPRCHAPQAVLQPRTRQAEHFSAPAGRPDRAPRPAAHGGNAVGYVENGDWISFTPYNLTGVTSFTARVASAGAGGTLTAAGRLADRPGGRHGHGRADRRLGDLGQRHRHGHRHRPGRTHAVPGVHRRRRARCSTSTISPSPPAAPSRRRATNLALNRPATASSVEAAPTRRRRRWTVRLTTRWAQRVRRPAVDPGRPGPVVRDQPGEADLGGGVRVGVPDPDLGRRHDLDHGRGR